jgi:aminoglycoside phosphotransferase (APT) family kinase protein
MSIDLDVAGVEGWLTENMAGFKGPLAARKIPGGQSNPTFWLTAGSGEYVLRRKPSGKLLKSAHAVDREFRVQQALQGTNVPVAEMLVLCDDDSVTGSMFYVMQAVNARNLTDPRLPGLENAERRAIMAEMGRVLAAIHEVDLQATGLSDYGPEGNYYERQTSRWAKQYAASRIDEIPRMEALGNWLMANIPPDDGQRTLVHGDFRIDNMLFANDAPECVAMLDWELSTTGHPYADLAALIMQWQMPTGTEGRGLAGVDRAALGLPSDAEFIADYCKRRGLAPIENFGFYLAFSFFRMGAILQGVLRRAVDGNASDPERGKKLGAYVPMFADAGLKAAGQG